MKWMLWFPCLLMLLLAGCVKNEVTLTFRLPEDVNNPCRILYYASGENIGLFRETVAEITGGKGEMKLPERYPALIYLFSPAKKSPAVVIYARRGDKFIISGEGENVVEWGVSGNAVTDSLSAWRLRNARIITADDTKEINESVRKFVKANPDSKASVIILYHYFMRRGNETEFHDLVATLGKDVLEDDELLRALSSADLMDGVPPLPEYPESMVLTGESGYADTLKLGGKQATLLIFKGGNTSAEDFRPDTLKKVAAKWKKVKMAELYADSDSSGWRRHIRRDTIPELERYWLPLGIVDSVALRMEVRRMPYFILLDSARAELYSGGDWREALNKLETLNKTTE